MHQNNGASNVKCLIVCLLKLHVLLLDYLRVSFQLFLEKSILNNGSLPVPRPTTSIEHGWLPDQSIRVNLTSSFCFLSLFLLFILQNKRISDHYHVVSFLAVC